MEWQGRWSDTTCMAAERSYLEPGYHTSRARMAQASCRLGIEANARTSGLEDARDPAIPSSSAPQKGTNELCLYLSALDLSCQREFWHPPQQTPESTVFSL